MTRSLAPHRPRWITDGLLLGLRWAAMSTWAVLLLVIFQAKGIPFDREQLLVWLMSGLIAFSIGVRPLWTVVVDWLPFAAVMLGYDYARGAADTLGMPVWWHPQLDVDKLLFGNRVPNVWLQEHLKAARPTWFDGIVALVYFSFFFLPYVTAAVFWVRGRSDFHRWAARFVTMSFTGFALFALIPAAPPWMAAKCSAAQVADHPALPSCIFGTNRPDGGLLGQFTAQNDGAVPYLQRISTRGWSYLHIHQAQALVDKGQATSDIVAAVPSLHAGGIMLFTIFLWRRANRGWRALLVAYNLLMAVALVYAGEHYVSDILAGWLVAWGVSATWDALERRWPRRRRGSGRAALDTLEARSDRTSPPFTPPSPSDPSDPPEGAPSCPPIATMPSST